MAATTYLLLTTVLAVFAAVAAIPLEQPDNVDFQAAAKKFQENAQKQFEDFKNQAQANLQGLQHLPQLDVKNLPKDGNSHVYGQSESKYHVETNVNGHKTSESGGRKIINDDGKITEYDLA